jgi:hypothetical protein
MYPNRPGTFLPIYAALALSAGKSVLTTAGTLSYFQGVGGTGALPFFHGVGGTGALPFFQGVGGTGALPFAMITAPLSCAVTTVFRLIAPTKIIMARSTTVSLRDITYLRGNRTTRRYFIYIYTNVKQLDGRACFITVHGTRQLMFAYFSPVSETTCTATGERIGFRTLYEQRYAGTKQLSTRIRLPTSSRQTTTPASTMKRMKRPSLDGNTAKSVA